MVAIEKARPAALAVQAIVASTRYLAQTKAAYESIAESLDCADYLLGLMLRPDDCTLRFEEALRSSAELFGAKAALALFLDESR